MSTQLTAKVVDDARNARLETRRLGSLDDDRDGGLGVVGVHPRDPGGSPPPGARRKSLTDRWLSLGHQACSRTQIVAWSATEIAAGAVLISYLI